MRIFDEFSTPLEYGFSIDAFFDEMDLSKIEIEKRKKFAMSMEEVMLFIFMLFSTMQEYNSVDKDFIVNQLKSRYWSLAAKYFSKDTEAAKAYIDNFANEIIDTTIAHGAEDYWLSGERAAIIAVNEALSIAGYSELQEKIEQGYTKKRWITEKDNKVRKTHREVDGVVLPILDYFLVGESFMLFAHDNFSELGKYADPKEIIGCRCVTVYEN